MRASVTAPLAVLLLAPLAALGAAGCGGALGAVGCGGAPAVRAPVAAPCDPTRIGEVRVAGTAPADVPGLAVLQGTHDDDARVERSSAAAGRALRWRRLRDRGGGHRARGRLLRRATRRRAHRAALPHREHRLHDR